MGSAGADVVAGDGGWLWQPRPVRHIGYAAYDYGFEISAVMPLDFDGIVFIGKTSPSRPLRRPVAPP